MKSNLFWLLIIFYVWGVTSVDSLRSKRDLKTIQDIVKLLLGFKMRNLVTTIPSCKHYKDDRPNTSACDNDFPQTRYNKEQDHTVYTYEHPVRNLVPSNDYTDKKSEYRISAYVRNPVTIPIIGVNENTIHAIEQHSPGILNNLAHVKSIDIPQTVSNKNLQHSILTNKRDPQRMIIQSNQNTEKERVYIPVYLKKSIPKNDIHETFYHTDITKLPHIMHNIPDFNKNSVPPVPQNGDNENVYQSVLTKERYSPNILTPLEKDNISTYYKNPITSILKIGFNENSNDAVSRKNLNIQAYNKNPSITILHMGIDEEPNHTTLTIPSNNKDPVTSTPQVGINETTNHGIFSKGQSSSGIQNISAYDNNPSSVISHTGIKDNLNHRVLAKEEHSSKIHNLFTTATAIKQMETNENKNHAVNNLQHIDFRNEMFPSRLLTSAQSNQNIGAWNVYPNIYTKPVSIKQEYLHHPFEYFLTESPIFNLAYDKNLFTNITKTGINDNSNHGVLTKEQHFSEMKKNPTYDNNQATAILETGTNKNINAAVFTKEQNSLAMLNSPKYYENPVTTIPEMGSNENTNHIAFTTKKQFFSGMLNFAGYPKNSVIATPRTGINENSDHGDFTKKQHSSEMLNILAHNKNPVTAMPRMEINKKLNQIRVRNEMFPSGILTQAQTIQNNGAWNVHPNVYTNYPESVMQGYLQSPFGYFMNRRPIFNETRVPTDKELLSPLHSINRNNPGSWDYDNFGSIKSMIPPLLIPSSHIENRMREATLFDHLIGSTKLNKEDLTSISEVEKEHKVPVSSESNNKTASPSGILPNSSKEVDNQIILFKSNPIVVRDQSPDKSDSVDQSIFNGRGDIPEL